MDLMLGSCSCGTSPFSIAHQTIANGYEQRPIDSWGLLVINGLLYINLPWLKAVISHYYQSSAIVFSPILRQLQFCQLVLSITRILSIPLTIIHLTVSQKVDTPKSLKHPWLVVWNIFFSPYIGNVVIPIDFHIFQRGGSTTNQIHFDRIFHDKKPSSYWGSGTPELCFSFFSSTFAGFLYRNQPKHEPDFKSAPA